MLSDSSNSDGSLFKNNQKKSIKEPSDSEEDDNIFKRKTHTRRRVSSSSASSGSGIVGPSHKKSRIISESESESCTSTDSEIDEVFRPWTSKNKLPKSRTALQTDSECSNEEYNSLDNAESKTKNEDQSSDSDEGEKCIICFKAFHGVIAHPSGCSHNFHSECLLTWSKTSNTCPIDRVKYTEVIVTGSKGEVVRHDVATPPPQNHNNDIEPDDTTFCEVCNQHDREHEMLLCDRCEAGYHLDCLNPPLYEVPIGDWYCPDCSSLQNVSRHSLVLDTFRWRYFPSFF